MTTTPTAAAQQPNTEAPVEHRAWTSRDEQSGSYRWSCTCGDGSRPVLPMHAAESLAANHEQSANAPRIPDQPDGIEDDSPDLPDPHRAAQRVCDYITAWGDGLIDTADGKHPLYARDLVALAEAVLNATPTVGRDDSH